MKQTKTKFDLVLVTLTGHGAEFFELDYDDEFM